MIIIELNDGDDVVYSFFTFVISNEHEKIAKNITRSSFLLMPVFEIKEKGKTKE